MTPGTLALWIGAGFAVVAASTSYGASPGDARARVGARSVVMAAVFVGVALVLLLDALRRHDIAVDFVARHTMRSLPTPASVAAILSDAAGTGLVAAVALGVAAGWLVRQARSPLFTVTAATVMLVLLAAPLAGHPLALLPWTPVDGQDPQSLFRVPWATLGALAGCGAVVASAVTVGACVEMGSGRTAPVDASRVAWGAMFLATVTMLVGGWARIAAGLTRQLAPLWAGHGASLLAVVLTLMAAVGTRRESVAHPAKVELALGALLATLARLLMPPSAAFAGSPVLGLDLLALAASAVGLWHARGGLSGGLVWGRGMERVALGATLGIGLLAAALDATVDPRPETLAANGRVVSGGATLHPLGVSRYEEPDAQVLALALERRSGGRTQLQSAVQREYTDARGSIVGGIVRTPAVVRGLATTFVWLDSVGSNDAAHITVATSVSWPLWWLALASLAIYVGLVLTRPPATRETRA